MRFFFLLITLLISTPVFSADNYIKYYNLSNEAKNLYTQKEFKKALEKIESAFDCVAYVHNEKLLLASGIAAGLRDYKLASTYIERGFSQGVLLNTIMEDSVFIDFIATSYFKKLSKKYDKLHSRHVKHLNNNYATEIDSLYYVDQFVIRSSTAKPQRIFKVNVTDSSIQVNDSAVFFSFMALVQEFGFPTERFVRRESLRGAYIIVHHFVRIPKNEIYFEKLKSLLHEGKFMPFYYAWAYDQSVMMRKEKPFYYCGIQYDKSKLTNDDLQKINLRRSEIGLEPLDF